MTYKVRKKFFSKEIGIRKEIKISIMNFDFHDGYFLVPVKGSHCTYV